ncbi:MAG: acetyl-CoA synthetase [Proteobacteria bacterium]|nr:acetyl-CoA synthetase [Pseudomonadota bacterium]
MTTDNLDRLFFPKNIAVIGATPKKRWSWASGNSWIQGSLKQGFQGSIYPVHPTAESIMGLKVYSSVLDIPDEIDLAIFTVPFTIVEKVLRECVQKGVKFVHLLTAGFSETGRQEFIDIENKLVEIAREGGIRLVGPNCMGLYSPKGGLSWDSDFPFNTGSVGFFSQSGQLAYQVIESCKPQKIFFSKAVSFGNGSDLQAHDFLEYLKTDDQTEIIGGYLEGLRNGRRFFETAREVTRQKPVVILKGGQTDGGSRATVSHTSAVAGSQVIWDAMSNQTGIISVETVDEMTFTLQALKMSALPKSLNVAILGGAGGGSVTMTDFAEKEGLKVPHLTDETIGKLEAFIPLQGSSAKNPLDILPAMRSKEDMIRLMELLRDDANIDSLVFNMTPSWIYRDFGRSVLNEYLQMIKEAAKVLEKPLFIVMVRDDDPQMVFLRQDVSDWFHDAGMATFPDFRLTARILFSLKKYSDYLASFD